MTPPLHTLLESQILVALARAERVSVIGWVSTAQVRDALPVRTTDQELDTVLRRMVKRGQVELFAEDRPPCVAHQALRRVIR